jgi:hypothetical protein
MVALMPKISSLGWEQSMPFVISAFFNEIEEEMTSDQVAKMSPSTQLIENLVFEFAVESSILTRDCFEHAGIVFTSFDKADASKGKLGGCVKLEAAFDDRKKSAEYPEGEVIVSTLDADKSGDTSKAVADSVVHSFKKLILDNAAVCGITTYSGGAGQSSRWPSVSSRRTCWLMELSLEIALCTISIWN